MTILCGMHVFSVFLDYRQAIDRSWHTGVDHHPRLAESEVEERPITVRTYS